MAGKCQGQCKGTDRSSLEPPAVWATTGDNRRLLWCPCCEDRLRVMPKDFTTGAPNVKNDLVETRQLRFEDSNCGYDVVVLSEIKAR